MDAAFLASMITELRDNKGCRIAFANDASIAVAEDANDVVVTQAIVEHAGLRLQQTRRDL